MSTTEYNNYIDQTMRLANSIVIKSLASAIALNEYVEELGHKVSSDPREWKYYQNISGEYHFLDTPMEIVSLDTLETIPFTRDSLELHLNTMDQYRPGTRYYQRLVERFPSQELLIRGILSPVEKEEAIAADDFKILFIEQDYVDPNESNLVWELQKRINHFFARWDNPGYRISDDLYVVAQLGVLAYNLPLFILNIRLKNCKTGYAHHFHIREYLKSHGRLDLYFERLTRKQRLFLYRNIVHIENNAGKQETFDWLEQNLISARGIGLAEYEIRHNIENLPGEVYPDIDFLRKPLNPYHRSTRDEEHSLSELLFKQRGVARSNQTREEEVLGTDPQVIKNSPRSKLPTKVLESSMVDMSESGFVTRLDFLINHWVYWAATDRYFTVLNIPHPRTGNLMDIPIKDAFIIYLYAFNKSFFQELPTIPKLRTRFIRKQPAPRLDELKAIVDKDYVPVKLIKEIAKERVDGGRIFSPAGFITEAEKLFEDANRQKEIYDLQEHYKTRGYVQGLIDHLYKSVDCELAEGTVNYKDWFWENGYSFEDLTRDEYTTLANLLLDEATGMNLSESFSTAQVQRAMISIMSQLSSYAVHFITEVNEDPIIYYNWLLVRMGDQKAFGEGHQYISILGNNPESVKTRSKFGIEVNPKDYSRLEFSLSTIHHIKIEYKNKINLLGHDRYHIRTRLPKTNLDVVYPEIEE